MKKFLKVLLFLIVILSIGFVYYSKVYKIKNDIEVVKNGLIKLMNRSTVIIKDIDVKEELNIDNKKYVFFIINNKLGDAELTKGINNKYKINTVGYGSGSLRDEISKTNKGKYLILKGKNVDNKIAYIKLLLGDNEYKINIPEKEYYMVYCSVPNETERTFLDINNVKFYNESDNDITDDILKN